MKETSAGRTPPPDQGFRLASSPPYSEQYLFTHAGDSPSLQGQHEQLPSQLQQYPQYQQFHPHQPPEPYHPQPPLFQGQQWPYHPLQQPPYNPQQPPLYNPQPPPYNPQQQLYAPQQPPPPLPSSAHHHHPHFGGPYELGSEAHIGYRTAKRYGIDRHEWTESARRRRWG